MDEYRVDAYLEQCRDQADQTQYHHLGDQRRVLQQTRNALTGVGIGVSVARFLGQGELGQDVTDRGRDITPACASCSRCQEKRQPAYADYTASDIHPAPGNKTHGSHDQESSPDAVAVCGLLLRLIDAVRSGRIVALDSGTNDGQGFGKGQCDQRG